MSACLGDWMQTFTGRQFWPLDPRGDEVFIEDIAHALANQCRFAGHVREFYSVAEHSVRVARFVENVQPENTLWGLLHDASEAYLVDLPRPIKKHSQIGEHYQAAERSVMAAICDRFGLPREEPQIVKRADDVLLMTEARDLMTAPPVPWRESGIEPLTTHIRPFAPEAAETLFISMFKKLVGV